MRREKRYRLSQPMLRVQLRTLGIVSWRFEMGTSSGARAVAQGARGATVGRGREQRSTRPWPNSTPCPSTIAPVALLPALHHMSYARNRARPTTCQSSARSQPCMGSNLATRHEANRLQLDPLSRQLVAEQALGLPTAPALANFSLTRFDQMR